MIQPHQIRAGRALVGMTQQRLADLSGLTQITIANIETGRTQPSKSSLVRIKTALELSGVEFVAEGVRLVGDVFRIIDGQDCFLRLLDDVFFSLNEIGGEVLITGCDEAKNTPEVSVSLERLYASDIRVKMIIGENAAFILGDEECYRVLPSPYFANFVTMVYGDKYAVVLNSGGEFRVNIIYDRDVADAQRRLFSFIWHNAARPSGIKRLSGYR